MEKQYLKYHIKMALFDSYKKLFFKVDKFINNLSFFYKKFQNNYGSKTKLDTLSKIKIIV